MDIIELNAATVKNALPELIALMTDSIESGASIGFMLPVDESEVHNYWLKRVNAITDGECILLAAYIDDVLVGSAQLGLELRANGSHRAEVQKVMVHTVYRRKGIGRKLMDSLEAIAHNSNRTLLFLDTRGGDPSNDLYLAVGYVHAGTIPNYARSIDGTLHSTMFYYKILS
jgi:ribosomal protein S18 acetylase RimI-like enzyme